MCVCVCGVQTGTMRGEEEILRRGRGQRDMKAEGNYLQGEGAGGDKGNRVPSCVYACTHIYTRTYA